MAGADVLTARELVQPQENVKDDAAYSTYVCIERKLK